EAARADVRVAVADRVHVALELRQILAAGDLVAQEVAVQHAAAALVHDALLVQRVADALDHRAEHLALGELLRDDEAAVLHAEHAQHAHDAGPRVDLDLRHLHAALRAMEWVTPVVV